MGKTIALRFENVSFRKKPSLYALKTLNLKLTLPSLANMVHTGTLRVLLPERAGSNKPRSQSPPWMKEVRDKTWGRGGLPTLPGLYLSTFQPSQRGFFRIHTFVCREREPEPEFLNPRHQFH